VLKVLQKLDKLVVDAETSLVAKAQTDTLDDLRLQAGYVKGLRSAIQVIARELNEEVDSNGKQS
jgi:hypothetical protein